MTRPIMKAHLDSASGMSTARRRRPMPTPTVAKIADRYGVSDTAAAALCSVTAQNLGVPDFVADRCKIRSKREKLRDSTKTIAGRNRPLLGLYFDGRKDCMRGTCSSC